MPALFKNIFVVNDNIPKEVYTQDWVCSSELPSMCKVLFSKASTEKKKKKKRGEEKEKGRKKQSAI
jgi:hypothetical protein